LEHRSRSSSLSAGRSAGCMSIRDVRQPTHGKSIESSPRPDLGVNSSTLGHYGFGHNESSGRPFAGGGTSGDDDQVRSGADAGRPRDGQRPADYVSGLRRELKASLA